MGRAKRTKDYDQRIAEALDRGSGPESVRELARTMRERYPDLRGTSYGGIRGYAEGKVRNPRIELLQAMAEVLGVRWEWLAYDEGEMTEEKEGIRVRAATATAEATIRVGDLFRLTSAGLPLPGLPEADGALSPILSPIEETLGLRPRLQPPPWASGIVEVWQQLTLSGEGLERSNAQCIADAIRAPMDALGVDPSGMQEDGTLAGYVLSMIPALLSLAGELRVRSDLGDEEEAASEHQEFYWTREDGLIHRDENGED